ncbi:TPA: hypothetical protein ACH3X1_011042 [Trebouxia sp. C0004]
MWAMEFFDFAGQKAAEKLQKYLHLEEVQDVIPPFDSVSHAEQLAQGITERLQANEHELESDILHDAAILEKRYIYVFNLDNEPASCNVYPLLPQDNFKWHQKISGLMKALNIPVGAMANLLPPHLLVMRMLEVVKEALVHSEVIINCAEQ